MTFYSCTKPEPVKKASSMGVLIDSQMPHLIGMDNDILSTGVIIYHLKVWQIYFCSFGLIISPSPCLKRANIFGPREEVLYNKYEN
jgi:hypothetical protein